MTRAIFGLGLAHGDGLSLIPDDEGKRLALWFKDGSGVTVLLTQQECEMLAEALAAPSTGEGGDDA